MNPQDGPVIHNPDDGGRKEIRRASMSACKWRLLCCGDRNWNSRFAITQVLELFHVRKGGIECVIEGEAHGADRLSRVIAEIMGIPVLRFPAEWNKFGKRAGPIRNQQMLEQGKPNAVIAFHNDIASSRGTRHMLTIASKANLPCALISVRPGGGVEIELTDAIPRLLGL